MSSLIPQFRRPGVGTSLGNHEARIRALERASRPGGDYVFLQETTLDVTASTFEFDSIDQGYEHLVLELLLQADPTSPDTGPYDAYVLWTPVDDAQSYDWTNELIPDDSQNTNTDDSGVALPFLIPKQPATDPLFAMVTVKFPYYSRASLVKGCFWEAVSIPDGDENITWAGGSGMSTYHIDSGESYIDPITMIMLAFFGSPAASFSPGSGGQLYGIKTH